MAISVICRKCSEKYSLKETAAGKTFKCKGCGIEITVPAPSSEPPVVTKEKPKARSEVKSAETKPVSKTEAAKTRPVKSEKPTEKKPPVKAKAKTFIDDDNEEDDVAEKKDSDDDFADLDFSSSMGKEKQMKLPGLSKVKKPLSLSR